MSFVDELEDGFGWIEDARMRRASHALAADDRVWLVDPIAGDGVEERVRGLGEPAGVIQLLDRHDRACAEWAARLRVPLHVVPVEPAGTPFTFLPVVRRRFWNEAALWWPERRILVAADAVGTVPHYYRVGRERIGVHPLLRPTPPRALATLDPLHILVGHGEGVHGDGAAAALADAVAHARRRIPRWLLGLPRVGRR